MAAKRHDGNVFTGNPIDRLGDRRHDAAFIAGLLARDDAVLLAMRAGRHLVLRGEMGTAIARLQPAEVPALAAAIETRPTVLLGLLDGRPAIAIDLGDDEAALPPLPGAEFVDLRHAALEMAAADAALLAQARGFLHWRRTHRFCGRCGGACAPIEGGYVVKCTDCGTTHFPRTDPAVIMLVTRGGSGGGGSGDERALLARNARFGERRVFSTLAGFVEPGESLEETVAREVWEECGVRAHNVRYHSSQPWPFPASLMLGFTAETDDAAPVIDGIEIVEAAFFTRGEIRNHAAHGFDLPPDTSVSRRLIDDWCAQGEP